MVVLDHIVLEDFVESIIIPTLQKIRSVNEFEVNRVPD